MRPRKNHFRDENSYETFRIILCNFFLTKLFIFFPISTYYKITSIKYHLGRYRYLGRSTKIKEQSNTQSSIFLHVETIGHELQGKTSRVFLCVLGFQGCWSIHSCFDACLTVHNFDALYLFLSQLDLQEQQTRKVSGKWALLPQYPRPFGVYN